MKPELLQRLARQGVRLRFEEVAGQTRVTASRQRGAGVANVARSLDPAAEDVGLALERMLDELDAPASPTREGSSRWTVVPGRRR